MTPEEIKDFKIMLATFKFDLKSDLVEIFDEKINKILAERWKTDDARRRESTW